MNQFMKMKKKMSLAESTRQVLNKSIDLLHKVSNKKLSLEAAKKDLSSILSGYFVSIYPGKERIDDSLRVKFGIFFDHASDIVTKVDEGKTPLYEAIMQMNKVVTDYEPSEPEENKKEEDESISHEIAFSDREKEILIQEHANVFKEVIEEDNDLSPIMPTMVKEDKRTSSELLQEVITHKKELEKSISHLNKSLFELGFELRTISK